MLEEVFFSQSFEFERTWWCLFERTWWCLFERTWWWLFQKRVSCALTLISTFLLYTPAFVNFIGNIYAHSGMLCDYNIFVTSIAESTHRDNMSAILSRHRRERRSLVNPKLLLSHWIVYNLEFSLQINTYIKYSTHDAFL